MTGVDHQPKLIDKLVLQKFLSRLGASEGPQVPAILPLERSHRLGDGALQQPRGLPGRGSDSVVAATYFGKPLQWQCYQSKE
jgi:hypothetical protein